jgi:site-specific recombinase XerD
MCSDRCGGVVSAEPIGDDGWAKVVKKRAEAAGLDPALFSGHSMRACFLTSAAEAGADVLKMAEVSRHKSLHARATALPARR